jgi:hypothetical protein
MKEQQNRIVRSYSFVPQVRGYLASPLAQLPKRNLLIASFARLQELIRDSIGCSLCTLLKQANQVFSWEND